MPDESGTLRIHREFSRWRDPGDRYIVLLGNKKVGEIANSQYFEIPVDPGDHTLQLKIEWTVSKKLKGLWTGSKELQFSMAGSGTVDFVCRPSNELVAVALFRAIRRRDTWIELECRAASVEHDFSALAHRPPGDADRRKFWDPSQPQILQAATLFLYFGAVIGLLRLPFLSWVLLPVGILVVAGRSFGAFGMANRKRWGYFLAVTTALASMVGMVGQFGLNYTIRYRSFDLLYAVTLVVLLLHPQSRNHQRTWVE